MIIKESVEGKGVLNSLFRFAMRHKILVGLILVGGYSGVMFYLGVRAQESGFVREVIKPVVQKNVQIPINYIKAVMAKPKHIVLDIKHEDFQKLAYKRKTALAKKILVTAPDDFVPAEIRYQDQTLRARVRLKGDWLDHLRGDKWSFRIKLRGEDTFWGMKQFSIQHPRTRRFVYEWVYHEALRREGFIALRYDFVNVTVNGKDLGIYALEEHFEKRLLEFNRRREGPIIKFSEDVLWANRQQFYPLLSSSNPTGLRDWLSSEITPFKENLLMRNPALFKQFLKGKDLLESFRLGKLPASKVFDADKLARFFALSELLGGGHALIWANMRFYYNPVTSLLEPVGFDANAGLKMTRSLGAVYYTPDFPLLSLWRNVFRDPIVMNRYVRCLEEYSDKKYLDQLFEALKPALDRNLAILSSEFPSTGFSKSVFYRNQKFIKKLLTPARGLHPYLLRAGKDELVLQAGAIQTMPVEVLHASMGGAILPLAEPVILEGKKWLKPVQYTKLHFQGATGSLSATGGATGSLPGGDNLRLHYRVLGTRKVRSERVYPWPYLEVDKTRDLVREAPDFRTLSGLTVDEINKQVYFKPGRQVIDRDLVIPAGYRVEAGEGTILDLVRGAAVVSYSPIFFRGSEAAPITVTSGDGSGQGLAVMSTPEKSLLEYVRFDNLSNPAREGWVLTGAVTFYEAPVTISSCRFENNRCEDGLNIIRTDFSMRRTTFSGTQSDAFDGDFVTGKMEQVVFTNSGNDALDISGSIIEINDITVDTAGDKGLSAGERSRLTGRNVEILNTEIAVTGKDKSHVKLEDLKLSNCKVGFAVFKKKPEFGAADVFVTGLTSQNITVPHLVEIGSRLVLNGKAVPADRQKVEAMLYGVEFGKKSK